MTRLFLAAVIAGTIVPIFWYALRRAYQSGREQGRKDGFQQGYAQGHWDADAWWIQTEGMERETRQAMEKGDNL
jgi:flagellar biosynthesis/type III secretory pathway protein FliH